MAKLTHIVPDTLDSRLNYWTRMWRDLIESFNISLRGLELRSPQIILLYIADELTVGRFRNARNRQFIDSQLKAYESGDRALEQTAARYLFPALRDALSKGPDKFLTRGVPKYVESICTQLKNEFDSGTYFNAQLELLIDHLCDLTKTLDTDLLRGQSENLITAFILRGYALKTIMNFPKYLLTPYERLNGDVIVRFPKVKTNRRTHLSGTRFDRNSYNQALVTELDNMPVPARLRGMRDLFYAQPRRYTFIHRLVGIVGAGDFQIGNINIYSPAAKKDPILTCGEKELEANVSVPGQSTNVAVSLEAVDVFSGADQAVETITPVLDAISFYNSPPLPIEVSPEQSIAVSSDGHLVASQASSNPYRNPLYAQHFALKLEQLSTNAFTVGKLRTFADAIATYDDPTTSPHGTLQMALRFFTKAQQSIVPEDQFVNYWIGIEAIISPDDPVPLIAPEMPSDVVVSEVLSSLSALMTRFRFGWELYWWLRRIHESQEFNGRQDYIKLSPELLTKTNLNTKPDAVILLAPFIDGLMELFDATVDDYLKIEITRVHNFYYDEKIAYGRLFEWKSRQEQDITIIYQLRNRIMHDASFDRRLLPHYTAKARILAYMLIKCLIENIGVMSVSDLLARACSDCRRLFQMLLSGAKVNLLTREFIGAD